MEIILEDVLGYHDLVDPISGLTVQPWTEKCIETFFENDTRSPSKIMENLYKEIKKIGIHYSVNRDGNMRCSFKGSFSKCGVKYFDDYYEAVDHACVVRIANELSFS